MCRYYLPVQKSLPTLRKVFPFHKNGSDSPEHQTQEQDWRFTITKGSFFQAQLKASLPGLTDYWPASE